MLEQTHQVILVSEAEASETGIPLNPEPLNPEPLNPEP